MTIGTDRYHILQWLGGHWSPLVPIGIKHFNGSVAIFHHWYRSVQMVHNVGRRSANFEGTQCEAKDARACELTGCNKFIQNECLKVPQVNCT